MIKLLYPDGKYTDEEALEIIEFAAECRKRVKDQLYIIDETFRAEPAKFEYLILKTGETKQVETLERIENPVMEEEIQIEEPTKKMFPSHRYHLPALRHVHALFSLLLNK